MPSQDEHLDEDANHAHDQSRGKHAAPEAEGAEAREAPREAPADIGAEHVQGAMGEIHDARDAEDDGKARGDEKERRGARKPVERLDEEGIGCESGHGGSEGEGARKAGRRARIEEKGWRRFFAGRPLATSRKAAAKR